MRTPVRVLLVGLPRSGSTWVARVLSALDGVRFISEPDNEARWVTAARAKGKLGVYPVLDADADAPRLAALWDAAFQGRSERQLAGTRSHVARSLFVRSRTKRRARTPGRMQLRWGTKLAGWVMPPLAGTPYDGPVLVKSVFSGLCLPWIASRWSPSTIVLHRHPFAVIASMRDLGWSLQNVPYESGALRDVSLRHRVEPVPRSAPFLERSAWLYGVVTSELAVAGARYGATTMTHEELCAAPEKRFEELAVAVGLHWSRRGVDAIRETDKEGSGYVPNRVTANEVDRWKGRLDEDEQCRVRRALSSFSAVTAIYPDLAD